MRFSTTVLILSLSCLCPRARAQSPTPEPTPRFDVVDSPITAQELAHELGYEFYGATWKFSAPTYVRVRLRSNEGPASDVPAQLPDTAKPIDVYAPDEPVMELTVHALEKSNEDAAGSRANGHKHIGIAFKVNASGKHAPEPLNPSNAAPAGTMSFREGSGMAVSLSLDQGPDQGFNHEWLYANGNLSVAFQGADAAEAVMHAAPLKICYYKGEISGLSDKAKAEGKGGAFDQVQKHAVVLVTLECASKPFKDGATSPR